jgi:hypothetical protein
LSTEPTSVLSTFAFTSDAVSGFSLAELWDQ